MPKNKTNNPKGINQYTKGGRRNKLQENIKAAAKANTDITLKGANKKNVSILQANLKAIALRKQAADLRKKAVSVRGKSASEIAKEKNAKTKAKIKRDAAEAKSQLRTSKLENRMGSDLYLASEKYDRDMAIARKRETERYNNARTVRDYENVGKEPNPVLEANVLRGEKLQEEAFDRFQIGQRAQERAERLQEANKKREKAIELRNKAASIRNKKANQKRRAEMVAPVLLSANKAKTSVKAKASAVRNFFGGKKK